MGIPATSPVSHKTTYDAPVALGYGTPDTRRLPYADYGLALAQAVTAHLGNLQTVATSSYGADQLGLEQWSAIHIDPGGPNEEYTYVHSADPLAQTTTAIFRRNHAAGDRIRPTVWPPRILEEGDDLAFDILAVATPDPGPDRTVVIQTGRDSAESHYRRTPRPSARKICSCGPAVAQHSASLPLMTTAGTRRMPKSLARAATSFCLMSSTVTSQDSHASRFTSAIVSSQATHRALNTSIFRFSSVMVISPLHSGESVHCPRECTAGMASLDAASYSTLMRPPAAIVRHRSPH
jgi:hypothetical protein